MALTAALTAVLAFVLLRLASPRIGVELLLQIAKRLIRQALLIAQRIGQPLHRLLPLGLALAALRHAQVFHHLLEFLQRLLRLGKAALFHQLLNTVHHVLQVLLGQLHHVLRCLPRLIAIVLALRLLRFLPEIIFGGIAQLLHQLGNLIFAGAVFHRLIEPVLRLTHPLKRIINIAVLDLHRQIPQGAGNLTPGILGQAVILHNPLKPLQDHPEFEILHILSK